VTAEADRRQHILPALFRRLSVSEAALALGGFVTASHFRFVRWTNRLVRIPDAAFHAPWENDPAILVVWHGEHFLVPFIGPRNDRINVLTTLHRDGEIITRAGMHFGLKFVRGSGDHGKEFMRKKAVQAFTALLRLLRQGETVVVTADVPKVARIAGMGIVTLAKLSGRPIAPTAVVTSRRFQFDTWDRATLGLPFSRVIVVVGDPIRVAPDADHAAMEAARLAVQDSLDDVHKRAYAKVGATDPGAHLRPA
jgi:lysophospholipid acyltransferase (LPLAT)-like uncharacterized protein